MRSAFVEITKAVGIQNIRKMVSAKNDDVIQALSPYAPKKAFAPGVHERRLDCRSRNLDSCALRYTVELGAEFTVTISNDHIGTLAKRCDIAKLGPSSARLVLASLQRGSLREI